MKNVSTSCNNLTEEEKNQIAFFNNISKKLITTQEKPYNKYFSIDWTNRLGNYSIKDVKTARENNDDQMMRKISRNFYQYHTSYRRMVDFLANLYCYYYQYDIIDGSYMGKEKYRELYKNSMNFIEHMNIPLTFQKIAQDVIIDGVFYGYATVEKGRTVITRLDPDYCRKRYQSFYGTQLVEFDLRYFNKYVNSTEKAIALKHFPLSVRRKYELYNNSVNQDPWVVLPTNMACAFSLGSSTTPIIYDSIIDILNFNDYKDIEKQRDSQELQKLLIQQFKLDADGNLKTLLEEMAAMHEAVTDALKDSSSIDVVTTIADTVKLESAQDSSNSATNNNIMKMLMPKYENAGLSYELFSSTTATSLESSLNNSTSFMSTLMEDFSNWISIFVYSQFAFEETYPVVKILPITWYNRTKMLENSLKNAQYGYSLRLPFIIMGTSQSAMLDHKYLENEVLKITDILKPLQSSHTLSDKAISSEDAGKANEKPMEEKSERTIQNIESK